jgi:hypothetical protein
VLSTVIVVGAGTIGLRLRRLGSNRCTARAVIRAVMPAPPVEVAGGGSSQQLKITCYLLLLPAAAG